MSAEVLVARNPGKQQSVLARALGLAATGLLLAGSLLAVRDAYLRAKAALAAALIAKAWTQTIRSGREARPWPWADAHPVARLVIPALGYDELVLSDASPRTLAFGPGHLSSSAAPGEAGNMVIAGHRTSWFEPLRGAAVGQTIRLEWTERRSHRLQSREYRIRALHIVAPSDVTYLASTDEDALTLVTCYPFGRGPRSPLRLMVRAVAL
ncbi:MAG TPA: class GN sortase [Vicinamibacteria bacterium]